MSAVSCGLSPYLAADRHPREDHRFVYLTIGMRSPVYSP
jgi:hypothetical protein